MKRNNLIIMFLLGIIIIIVTIVIIFKNNNNSKVNVEKHINTITKDEAYSLLKEFYLDENDVLIFINETENEFIFEQKGSCKFAKCEYHINKETKEVYTFTEEKDNFN